MNSERTNTNFERRQANSSVAIAIGTIVTAFTAILGLFLIINELDKVQSQNNLLEASIRESYRPVAIALDDPNSDTLGVIELGAHKGVFDKFFFKKDLIY